MNEKLKVTAHQAASLDIYTSYGNTLQFFLNIKKWGNTYSPIKEFNADMMARALYVGYEIEKPKVKVGEWATNTECNHTFKVYAVTEDRIVREEDARFWDKGNISLVRLYTHKHTRPLTKEEVFWAELGREYQTFELGDVLYRLKGCGDGMYPVVEWGEDGLNVHEALNVYKKGECDGFYPAESFIKFPK